MIDLDSLQSFGDPREVRDDTRRRLCRWFLGFGGPGHAAVGGVGSIIVAGILLGQGKIGEGIGFAALSLWCAVAYRITTRCRRLLQRTDRIG